MLLFALACAAPSSPLDSGSFEEDEDTVQLDDTAGPGQPERPASYVEHGQLLLPIVSGAAFWSTEDESLVFLAATWAETSCEAEAWLEARPEGDWARVEVQYAEYPAPSIELSLGEGHATDRVSLGAQGTTAAWFNDTHELGDMVEFAAEAEGEGEHEGLVLVVEGAVPYCGRI